MTFEEIYRSKVADSKAAAAEANAFVEGIASITKKSAMTVRMWIYGRQRPDALTIEVIANHLGSSPEELFPTTTKTVKL